MDDEVHLLALEERLHEDNLGGTPFLLWQIFREGKLHGIGRNGRDYHASDSSVRIRNRHFIPDLRTHHACEMVGIATRDRDFLRKRSRIEETPHQSSNSSLRRIIIAAHSFSQVISRTV